MSAIHLVLEPPEGSKIHTRTAKKEGTSPGGAPPRGPRHTSPNWPRLMQTLTFSPVQSIHTNIWRYSKSMATHLSLPRLPLQPRPRQHGRRRHPTLRQDHPGHAASASPTRPNPTSFLIRVILGKHEPDDKRGGGGPAPPDQENNVYTRAAESLRAWRKEHILAEESRARPLRLLPETYTRSRRPSEVRRATRPQSPSAISTTSPDKVVYRHEQTFPKHKSDRMVPLQSHPSKL